MLSIESKSNIIKCMENKDSKKDMQMNNIKTIQQKADKLLKILRLCLFGILVLAVINVIANIAEIYRKSFNGWLSLTVISTALGLVAFAYFIVEYVKLNNFIKQIKTEE